MSTESETKSAGVPAGATLLDILEDVSGHLRIEGVDTEGGWQCVECGQPQPEMQHEIKHAEGCSVGAFEDLLAKLAEAGPAPTTAAPAEQLSGKVCPHGIRWPWECKDCLYAAEQPGKAADPRAVCTARFTRNGKRQGCGQPNCSDPDHRTQIAEDPRPARPQAPAEPSKEQFDKAGRVLAAVMDAERRGENMDPIIARALAAEAATLREERDRLAERAKSLVDAREAMKDPPASAPPRKAPQEGCKACALVAKEFGTDKCPWCGRPFGTTVGYVEKCSAMHHAVRSAMGLDKPAYDARPSSPEEQLSGKELK